MPELRVGYPPLRKTTPRETRKMSRKFGGLSAPTLYKNTSVTEAIQSVNCSKFTSTMSSHYLRTDATGLAATPFERPLPKPSTLAREGPSLRIAPWNYLNSKALIEPRVEELTWSSWKPLKGVSKRGPFETPIKGLLQADLLLSDIGLLREKIASKMAKALRLEPPYTGVPKPSGPEIPKKSQKGVPGPPAPECQKSVEKIPNDPKKCQKDSKISVWGLFRHFFDTPRGEAREVLFETFWGFRGSGVWRLLYMGIAHATKAVSLKSPFETPF